MHNKLRFLDHLNDKIREERDKRANIKAEDSFATFHDDDSHTEGDKKDDEEEIKDVSNGAKYDDFGNEITGDNKPVSPHFNTNLKSAAP